MGAGMDLLRHPVGRLVLTGGSLAGLEVLGRGLGALLAGLPHSDQLGAALPWCGPSLAVLEPVAILGWLGAGGYLVRRVRTWQNQTLPAARLARTGLGHLLEVRLPPDSTTDYRAFQSILEQLFAPLQATRRQVEEGEAITPSWEIWCRPAGVGLFCWLPAWTPDPLVQALAAKLRAGYPGARVLRVSDPLRQTLATGWKTAAQPGTDLIVGLSEFRLRAPAEYPLRDPGSFSGDPLGALVTALGGESMGATSPLRLVGIQFVTCAYNGAWRDQVAGRIAALRALEGTTKKNLLPASHAAEKLALARQADQLGYDTLVRAVVVGGPASEAEVRARLGLLAHEFRQYDAPAGGVVQGWESGPIQVGQIRARQPLPTVAVTARDRWVAPLGPLGRPLAVLGSSELAMLFHPPTRTLARQPGLACWQRTQIFAAPAGVLVPLGSGAADWMVTGQVPQDLRPPGTDPPQIGVRRAALNQHAYFLGPTRSGKTKLLENWTKQDLDAGLGVGVIDPKGGPDAEGDYAQKTVLMVPGHREGEVCWFNPVDPRRRVMTVNPLERRPGVDLDQIQSGVISITGKLGASWEAAPLGLRFMQHAIALLLDAEPHPTFLHLYKLLQNPKEGNAYRERLLARAHPDVAEKYAVMAQDFWANQVPGMKETQLGSMQTALTRLEAFLSNEIILRIVAQSRSTINLGTLMDNRGIFIASITPTLGESMQGFLGTMLLTLITQAGFARGVQAGDHPFWRLTVDEFQNFISVSGSEESFGNLLSMLGGLGVGLTMAHQAFDQISTGLRGVILGNVGTRVFYPSQEDAEAIARRLSGQVRADDLRYQERFWTTQVLPMASGTSGPVTVAPLGIAARAADLAEAAVPAAVQRHPAVARWGRAAVAREDLDSARLREWTGPAKDESAAQQQVRIQQLVGEFYGPSCEQDDRIVPILCALSAEDYAVYQAQRRAEDGAWRQTILAHPGVLGPVNGEAAKLRRVATLSDLAYGIPRIEAQAQVRRAMSGAGLNTPVRSPDAERVTGGGGRSGAPPVANHTAEPVHHDADTTI